jgi:hypothetical protein
MKRGPKKWLSEDERKRRQRAREKLWREAHPNYNKIWRKKNKDRVRDLKREWRSDPKNVKREEAWALARKERREKCGQM